MLTLACATISVVCELAIVQQSDIACAGGVDTASVDGVFDISNTDRLGHSEVELVQKVVDGVELLVKVQCTINDYV